MPVSGDNNPSSPTPGRKADQDTPSQDGYLSEIQQNSSTSCKAKEPKVVAVSQSDEEFNEIFDAVLERVQKEDEDASDDCVSDSDDNQKLSKEDQETQDKAVDADEKMDEVSDEQMEDICSDQEERVDNQKENSDDDNRDQQGSEDGDVGDAEDEQDNLPQDDVMTEFRDLQTPTFEDDDDFACMTPPRLSHRKSKTVKRRRKNDGKQPNQSKKLKGNTKSSSKLKGPSRKKKCLQERSVEEMGVWVQCMSRTCLKWRYLTDVTDPSLVPEVWMCEMNTDPLYNQCETPEQDYQSLEFVFNRFTEGSIVWAKMGGYPWWPAMVEEDPDVGAYMELDDNNKMPVQYHVVFLDQNITRAWLNSSCLKKFEDENSAVGTAFAKGRIGKARARACEALTLSIPERVKKFGFSHNFKGTIVENTQCTDSQDSAELELSQSSKSHHTKPSESVAKHSQSSGDEILDQTEALLHEAEEVLTNLDRSSSQQGAGSKEKRDSELKLTKEEKKRMKKERKAKKKEKKRKLKELARVEKNVMSNESKKAVTEEVGLEKEKNKQEKERLKQAKLEKKERKEKEKEKKKKMKEKAKLEKQEMKSKEEEERKALKEQAKLEKKEKLAKNREEKKLLGKLSKLDDQEKKNEAKKAEKEKRKEEKRKLKEQKKLDKKKQKEDKKKLKSEGQENDFQSGQKRKLDERNDTEIKEDQPAPKKLKEKVKISSESKEKTKKKEAKSRKPTEKPSEKVKPSFKPPSKVVPAFGTVKQKSGFKPPVQSHPTKADGDNNSKHGKGHQEVKESDREKINVTSKNYQSSTNKEDGGQEKKDGKSTNVESDNIGDKVKKVDSVVVEDDKKPKVKKAKFNVKRKASVSATDLNATSSKKVADQHRSSGNKETSSQDMAEPKEHRDAKKQSATKSNDEELQAESNYEESVAEKVPESTETPAVAKKDVEKSEQLDNDSDDFCLDMNWPENPSNDLEPESISEKVHQLLDSNSQLDSQPFDLVEE